MYRISDSLGIRYRIIYIDATDNPMNAYNIPSNAIPIVHLLYRPGHYDILYPITQQQNSASPAATASPASPAATTATTTSPQSNPMAAAGTFYPCAESCRLIRCLPQALLFLLRKRLLPIRWQWQVPPHHRPLQRLRLPMELAVVIRWRTLVLLLPPSPRHNFRTSTLNLFVERALTFAITVFCTSRSIAKHPKVGGR